MNHVLTTSIAKLASLFQILEEHGISRQDFLTRNDINPSILKSPDNRLPLEKVHRLTQYAVSITGDNYLGLHQGERFMGLSNILGYVMLNCRDMKQALSKLTAYQKICDEGMDIRLAIDRGKATVQIAIPHQTFATDQHLTDYRMSAMYTYLKRLTCKGFPLMQACFKHAPPSRADEYERIFKCPIFFDAPRNAMVFDSCYLDLPIPEHNLDLLDVMEFHAQKALLEIAPSQSYTHRVGQKIAALLPGMTPTIEGVANELGMSVRNLQLKLKSEKTTFSLLLNDLRKDLALNYLKDDRISITEIAYLLGYSEVSVFYRAFKKWTTQTPREVRYA